MCCSCVANVCMRKEASGAISFEGNQLVVVASALKRPITQKRPADTLYEKRSIWRNFLSPTKSQIK